MTCGNAALFNIGLCLFALLPSCKREAKSMKEVNVTKPHTVEIVPGESIGDVKLGTKAENMPSRATIQRPAGVLDDIHFLINEDGVVDDTWIEDLRVFPHAVRCQGKTIPPDATIESLSVLLGPVRSGCWHKGRNFLQLRRRPCARNGLLQEDAADSGEANFDQNRVAQAATPRGCRC